MVDPVTMFIEGGPLMFPILLFGAGGGLLALLWAVLAGLYGKWLPHSIGWLGLAACVCCGVLGVFMGIALTNEAVAHASEETKLAMMANGLSVSMFTLAMATMLSALGFALASISGALAHAVQPGPDARFDSGKVGGAVAGAIVGALIAAGTTTVATGFDGLTDVGPAILVLPVLALLVGGAVVVASLRTSEEDEPVGRQVSARIASGISGVLALGLGGTMFHTMGAIIAFLAVAKAAPEHKSQLLSTGMEIAGHSSTLGWSLASIPALAAAGGAAPLLSSLGKKHVADVAFAGLQALVVVVGVAVAAWQLGSGFGAMGAEM